MMNEEEMKLFHDSAGLSGGNQVDGSPPTRHTEVVVDPVGEPSSAHRCSGPLQIQNRCFLLESPEVVMKF